jgi:hypothetical protein
VTDLIHVFANAQWPSWVTPNVAASRGKRTTEGRMMWRPELKPNPMAVADPPEAQTSTPATTKRASDILTNCAILF